MKRFVSIVFLLFITTAMSAGILISPEDDARFGRHESVPVFTWMAQAGATEYNVEFSPDQWFTTYGEVIVTDAQLDLNQYISNEEWRDLAFCIYWRVSGNFGTSEIRFLTKSAISAPRVDQPQDARFDADDPPAVIQWDSIPGSSGYRLEIASDHYFSNSVTVDWGIPSLDFSTMMSSAEWSSLSTYFYYRVWAVDCNGLDGPYYKFFRFSKSVLPQPLIGQPAGVHYGARDTSPVFMWENIPGAASYLIQIALRGMWDGETLIYETTDHSLRLEDVMAVEEWQSMYGAYRWRVAVVEPSGAWTPWSWDNLFYKCGRHVITTLGDSITTGNVCIPESWVDIMEDRLRPQFNDILVFNASVGGTKAIWGAEVIRGVLESTLPEYMLMLFGANDSVDPGNCNPPYGCNVAGHLRTMVHISREYGTVPVIGTVLPVNPEGAHAYHQFRVDIYNDEIRAMAQEENVHIVDLNAAAWAYGDITRLYCDWGHPNGLGTALIANEFYEAMIWEESN